MGGGVSGGGGREVVDGEWNPCEREGGGEDAGGASANSIIMTARTAVSAGILFTGLAPRQRWTLRIQLPSAIPIEQKTIAITKAAAIPS